MSVDLSGQAIFDGGVVVIFRVILVPTIRVNELSKPVRVSLAREERLKVADNVCRHNRQGQHCSLPLWHRRNRQSPDVSPDLKAGVGEIRRLFFG
jgi:hypothetical protein